MVQPKMFLRTFHLTVVALNSYTIWYDQMFVDLPFPSKNIEEMPFKARHLFLTMWCLVLQTLYFGVSLLNDIYGIDSAAPKKPPFIRKLKDVIFSLAFPVALYVSMVFWGIYTIQKDLIFPHEIERLIPVWVNQVMHTLIVPFIIIELFATKINYPSRRFGIHIIITFISMYTLWVLFIYFRSGVWVYPFLGLLNWTMRSVFVVTSTCIGVCIYVLGERLNYLVSSSTKLYANGVNGDIKRH